MKTSRREFIKNSSLAIAGITSIPLIFTEKKTDIILGIQLYSVRDDMKKDPEGTLRKLSEMGYKYVEHAGYANGKFYGYSIREFKKLLTDLGLRMESGHSSLRSKEWDKVANDFTNEWKQTIKDAADVGMKFMISPGLDTSLCQDMDAFEHYIDMFNKTGDLCKKSGIHFGYHSENYEFNHRLRGTVLYDLLLQLTDKNLVQQEMDIGNMYGAGGRAMDFLKKYPGRFLLMHIRDELKRSTPRPNGSFYESTLLTKGVIPIKEIITYARKTGTKYFIIEQSEYQDRAPLECAAENLKAIHSMGFK